MLFLLDSINYIVCYIYVELSFMNWIFHRNQSKACKYALKLNTGGLNKSCFQSFNVLVMIEYLSDKFYWDTLHIHINIEVRITFMVRWLFLFFFTKHGRHI